MYPILLSILQRNLLCWEYFAFSRRLSFGYVGFSWLRYHLRGWSTGCYVYASFLNRQYIQRRFDFLPSHSPVVFSLCYLVFLRAPSTLLIHLFPSSFLVLYFIFVQTKVIRLHCPELGRFHISTQRWVDSCKLSIIGIHAALHTLIVDQERKKIFVCRNSGMLCFQVRNWFCSIFFQPYNYSFFADKMANWRRRFARMIPFPEFLGIIFFCLKGANVTSCMFGPFHSRL